MFTNFIKNIAGVAMVAALPFAASAGTLTSNTIVATGGYDFSTGPSIFTDGPEVRALGGGNNLTFTSTYSRSVLDFNSNYGLASNGSWTSARGGYAGLNDTSGAMSFTFDQGVDAVGGFINYAVGGFGDTILSAYDMNDALIESFNVTQDAAISTPSADDAGAFRGISSNGPMIYRFELAGAYVVIDDLVVGGVDSNLSAVPLPATLPLLAFAIGGIGLASRRRRTS